MTVKELSQYYYLCKEIEQYEARIEALYDRATRSVAVVSDMPRGYGASDNVGKYATEIALQSERLKDAKRRCVAELNRILDFIESIPDSLTRQIFTMRFIDKMGWAEIAKNVGGSNTASAMKQRVFRYLA